MATSAEYDRDANAPRAKNRWWSGKAAIIVTALVVVALLGVLLARILTATHAAARPAAHSGKPAPDVSVAVWNGTPGERLDLVALKGHPVVLNFWASWCGPCHDEAPTLAAAARQFQPRGVRFVGVAEQTSATDGMAFLRQYGITYPCGSDTTTDGAAVAYGLTGIPVTVLIDRHGDVARKFAGPLNKSAFDAAIEQLLR